MMHDFFQNRQQLTDSTHYSHLLIGVTVCVTSNVPASLPRWAVSFPDALLLPPVLPAQGLPQCSPPPWRSRAPRSAWSTLHPGLRSHALCCFFLHISTFISTKRALVPSYFGTSCVNACIDNVGKSFCCDV